jgi:hypothetical protein
MQIVTRQGKSGCDKSKEKETQEKEKQTLHWRGIFTTVAQKEQTNLLTTSFFLVFLLSWGGVSLSPLGASATNWPIAPAPDDR